MATMMTMWITPTETATTTMPLHTEKRRRRGSERRRRKRRRKEDEEEEKKDETSRQTQRMEGTLKRKSDLALFFSLFSLFSLCPLNSSDSAKTITRINRKTTRVQTRLHAVTCEDSVLQQWDACWRNESSGNAISYSSRTKEDELTSSDIENKGGHTTMSSRLVSLPALLSLPLYARLILGSGPEGVDELWYHTGRISVFVSMFLHLSVPPSLSLQTPWLPPSSSLGLSDPPAGLLTLQQAS